MAGAGEIDSSDEVVPAVLQVAAEAEEARLIGRARGGDRAAFDRLVEQHLRQVWSVVWRILRHREDAEDVVQEVFLAAYQGLAGYRREARFSTWLHRIAVTRALNHLDRKEEKMQRAFRKREIDLDRLENDATLPAAWRVQAARSPLQDLEASELMRRLAACLSRLPSAWRAILTLRDVDARSYEEIARVAGLALGTVRSRLARARLALRQCVEGEET